MNDDREHQVRQRAYALWESEGRPEGRHEEHWHRAHGEFGQDAAAPAADTEVTDTSAVPKPKAARRKPVAASPAAAEAPSAVDQSAAAPRKRRTVKPKAN